MGIITNKVNCYAKKPDDLSVEIAELLAMTLKRTMERHNIVELRLQEGGDWREEKLER